MINYEMHDIQRRVCSIITNTHAHIVRWFL